MQKKNMVRKVVGLTVLIASLGVPSWTLAQSSGEKWRGLTVAPENRCTSYDRDDYPYSQLIEQDIVSSMKGRIYGPYTGRYFTSTRETDVEHIVAASEAHDSGLCAADRATRQRFSADLLNLTLAAPEVNRCRRSGKCGHDAAGWLPPMIANQCWFAWRVVQIKEKYDLTVDRAEVAALDAVLATCTSHKMAFTRMPASSVTAQPSASGETVDALKRYDDNDNGRITCSEARQHGIVPVKRGHPAYRFMRDSNGDGVVCE